MPQHSRRETALPPLKRQFVVVFVVVALGTATLLIPLVAVKLVLLVVIALAFLVAVVVQG